MCSSDLPAPLIATALFATYHSGYAISIYIAACAVVSLVAASFMPDYTGKDISVEYDDYSFMPANVALRCQSNKADRSSWAHDDGVIGTDL